MYNTQTLLVIYYKTLILFCFKTLNIIKNTIFMMVKIVLDYILISIQSKIWYNIQRRYLAGC